ncbi:MAG: type II toxin-antitoxin system RelE/ParE family toxin [Egibacteraceae bacterium]
MVRVALTAFAVDDLRNLDPDIRRRAAKKLLHLSKSGDVGQPLGRALVGWRKVVLGNRDWRIIYRMSEDGSEATVWAVLSRGDDQCYRETQERIREMGDDHPVVIPLTAAVDALRSARRELDL